ncbi:MAG: holo-[acyl-carrier-protein] synthase [Fusobacteriia bacterium 4572_132]|nr:MAG: holo-[acyl-carrier-protein] synthase [Fusobacteriia bacterium 4572_132]
MDVVGIGNDIIEIDRIKKAIERNKNFKYKVYTDKEIKYAEKSKFPYNIYAGRFAAKEAISKAFGTGVRGFLLTDIEILNNELGKPDVILKNEIKKKYEETEIMVTISHSKENAIAMALIQKR